MASLTVELVGNLLDELSSKMRSGVSKGRVPPQVQRRVDSYNMFVNPWAAADHDILVCIAISELLWEDPIRPTESKDENALQLMFGVSATSRPLMQQALVKMREEHKRFTMLRDYCDALEKLALALSTRSLMGGPANFSQIQLDRFGYERVESNCRKNKAGVNKILQRLENILPTTEKLVELHASR